MQALFFFVWIGFGEALLIKFSGARLQDFKLPITNGIIDKLNQIS